MEKFVCLLLGTKWPRYRGLVLTATCYFFARLDEADDKMRPHHVGSCLGHVPRIAYCTIFQGAVIRKMEDPEPRILFFF